MVSKHTNKHQRNLAKSVIAAANPRNSSFGDSIEVTAWLQFVIARFTCQLDLEIRDDREWLFAFPFRLIPIQSIPISSQFPFISIFIFKFITISHSHGIYTGLFPFLPIPIPEQSFNCCGINNFGLSKTQTVHCLSF